MTFQGTSSSGKTIQTKVKAGPEPLLLSRKEVDILYDIFDVVRKALELLKVEYIVTGGSLLGAIRQHSILFCDDDIDIAVIDDTAHKDSEGPIGSVYESIVAPNLQSALDRVVEEETAEAVASGTIVPKDIPKYIYQIKPWEGGDRVRSKRFNNVFLDLFVLRKYPNPESFLSIIGQKRNGQPQPKSYTDKILNTIRTCIHEKDSAQEEEDSKVFPFWQFSTRKAIELWPKEVYRAAVEDSSITTGRPQCDELHPLRRDLKFGPLINVCGPYTPVTLLKRAFGDDCFEVYYRSISHQQPSIQQQQQSSKLTIDKSNGEALPPLVAPGGTWESSPKVPLEEEHYFPMQPLARKRRRPTLHCREALFDYIKRQTILEDTVITELTRERQSNQTNQKSSNSRSSHCRPRRTVYMDGVFDLFHKGHLEAIHQCAALGDTVILGVTGDIDAEGYKRRPIVPEEERVAIVGALKEVKKVVCPCPLIITEEFMNEHGIDLVVHGFANDADAERQKEFFRIPIELGKFQRIGYYKGLCTTDRIEIIREQNRKNGEETDEKIVCQSEDTDGSQNLTFPKPQWFGATLAAASNYSPTIPTDPFPISLRLAIEPHIDKARVRRKEALQAIRNATGASIYDSVTDIFRVQQERLGLQKVVNLKIEQHYHGQLLSSLMTSTGFPPNTDLSMLHKEPLLDGKGAKERLLYALTQNYTSFQESYDEFVRNICVPRMVAALDLEWDSELEPSRCNEIYYQAFPCLRIVQPGDFSIGPHSDVAYGHHPCSVNGYVSLTEPDTGGDEAPVSALFLESRPGAEDWHSLFGRHSSRTSSDHIETNIGKSQTRLFAGALNLHWTTENLTEKTRVTLDFRMIDGRVWETLCDGGQFEGGQKDVFRATPGYYHKCVRCQNIGSTAWIRDASYPSAQKGNGLQHPDFRVGFPWTVKNWDKFWKKQTKQKQITTSKSS